MVCMPLNCIAFGATFQQHHTTVMTTDKGHLRYIEDAPASWHTL